MNYTHHEWAPARYNPPLIEWVEFALALSLISFDSSLSFTHLMREDTLVSEQETPVCVCVCVCEGGGLVMEVYKFGNHLQTNTVAT